MFWKWPISIIGKMLNIGADNRSTPRQHMYFKYSQHKIQKHTFLYVVVLWIFAALFFIPLCYEYFQRVSVFVCWVCSVFLYFVVLWVFAPFLYFVAIWIFAALFCISLCCEYFKCFSLFSCILSICSLFLYLGEVLVLAVHFCIWFVLSLQCVSVFLCVVFATVLYLVA